MLLQDCLKAGSDAVKAGRLTDALELYSKAIAIDGESYLGFSNRAILRLKLGSAASAIDDADRAIAIKPDFAKAYSTKGSALFRLGRINDAIAAYRAGLLHDPANSQLQENLRACEQAAAGSNSNGNRTPQPGIFPQSGDAAPPAVVTSLVGAGSRVAQVVSLGRVALVALALLYLLPVGGLSYQGYYYFLLVSVIVHTASIYQKFGAPAETNMPAVQQWAMRLMMDSGLPPVMLPVLLYSAHPVVVGIGAVGLVDLWLAGETLQSVAAASLPILNGLLSKAGAMLAPRVLGKPASDIESMSINVFRAAMFNRLMYLEALCEVGLAILFLVELVTPWRSFITTLLLWQVMPMRYQLSPHNRKAFGAVDARLLALTNHSACPALVKKGYDFVRNFLISQANRPVEQAQQRAQGGQGAGGGLAGMMQSCNVM